ncbi:hypothetical protein OF83DRAFT_1154887 [Amylostereum chailletii]|nr:hypothetical protein OF83DRAFT_1154887 [Amylostereum chailletii]
MYVAVLILFFCLRSLHGHGRLLNGARRMVNVWVLQISGGCFVPSMLLTCSEFSFCLCVWIWMWIVIHGLGIVCDWEVPLRTECSQLWTAIWSQAVLFCSIEAEVSVPAGIESCSVGSNPAIHSASIAQRLEQKIESKKRKRCNRKGLA